LEKKLFFFESKFKNDSIWERKIRKEKAIWKRDGNKIKNIEYKKIKYLKYIYKKHRKKQKSTKRRLKKNVFILFKNSSRQKGPR